MGGSKFADDRKRLFVQGVARGLGPRTAAEAAGVTYQTIRKHLKDDPEFAAEVEHAQGLLIEEMESVVVDLGREGNLGALKMWLQNRAPGRWRSDAALGREASGPSQHVHIEHVSIALKESLTDPKAHAFALDKVLDIPVKELAE